MLVLARGNYLILAPRAEARWKGIGNVRDIRFRRGGGRIRRGRNRSSPAMQRNPATDWMYTADPGKAGLGLKGRRVPVPRGKVLGGSSGLNYMAYVRGHLRDFDSWAEGGASGWSYAEVLPYFRKSEALAPSTEIVIAADPAQNWAWLGSIGSFV